MKKEPTVETVFGRRLRDAAERAGRSVHAVAMDAKISPSNLYSTCSGKRGASQKEIESIAGVGWLEVSEDEIRAWLDADRLGEEGVKRLREHHLLKPPTMQEIVDQIPPQYWPEELKQQLWKEMREFVEADKDFLTENIDKLHEIDDSDLDINKHENTLRRNIQEIESSLGVRVEPVGKMKKVPVYGTASCGSPRWIPEYAEDWMNIEEMVAEDIDAVLMVQGNSMEGVGYFDGDRLLVRMLDGETPSSGNKVIASIDGLCTCKRYKKDELGEYLEACYTGDQTWRVPLRPGIKIVARVKYSIRKEE